MRIIFSTICLLAMSVSIAVAIVPPTMNYQGILTDASGTPVPDGAYSVTFSIYNSPTSALTLWSETQTLTTANGLFNTVLGTVTPIADTAVMDTAAYLEIAVQADPPLSPRTRLTSNAYSIVTSAVLGQGPILLEHEDLANGTQSKYSLDVKPNDGLGGKNIRKNISVVVGTSGESAELEEIIGVSDGAKSAVAIPAFMKNARKAKTAESAESREVLDTDSGFVKTVVIELPGDTLQLLEVASASGMSSAAVPIPGFMKNIRRAKAAEAASMRTILDIDSGYAEVAKIELPNLKSTFEHGTRQTKEHVLLARQVGVPGATASTSLELQTADAGALSVMQFVTPDNDSIVARKGANESAAIATLRTRVTALSQTTDHDDYASPDSTGTSMRMTKAQLTSEIATQSTQTREHVLLARQVGVTGSESHRSVELQTDDIGAQAKWLHANPSSDSSEIEVAIDDIEQRVTLATKVVGGTKWKNIVLKRGLSSTEMTLSHVAAGASNVLHATVDGAAGARLGINTSTPTLAFQLVGSGCYTGTFGVCSDARYKDHVATLANPLDMVTRLRGVSFDWKRDEFGSKNFPEGEQVGLIAQEVEDVVPSVVNTDATGYKSVDYARLVPLLIEAVKEQQRTIEAQNARIVNLESKLEQ